MSHDFKLTKFLGVANPPVGQGALITVPKGENWLVRTLKFNLVTSAAVGNRQPYLVFSKDGITAYLAGTPLDVPASTTQIFSFGAGGVNYRSTYPIIEHVYMPELWLPESAQIQIQCNGIQAGDQMSSIGLAVERP